jgi:hypothetical protein
MKKPTPKRRRGKTAILEAFPIHSRLEELSGYDEGVWMHIIQRQIKKHSGPPMKRGKYKGHSKTKVSAWVSEICSMLLKNIKDGKEYDGNMRFAAAAGMIFATWYVRIQKAKAMDPRRPLKLRRLALLRANEYVAAMNFMLGNEFWDDIVFHDQEWENPWKQGARDGDFV